MHRKRPTKRTTRKEKFILYLTILDSISEKNKLPTIPGKRIDYHWQCLRRDGFIKRIGYATWGITKKGQRFLKELQEKVKVSFQPIKLDLVLRLEFPIIKTIGKLPSDHDVKLRKWIRKYRWDTVPIYNIGLTIQGPTTKNKLHVYVHHIRLEKPEDINIVINAVKKWVREYYSIKKYCLVDEVRTKVTYLKYGIHDPLLKEVIPKGVYEEITLGRPRAKILPADEPTEAKVWFEKTPFDWTIHSNDKTYVKRYLMMPETVDKLDRTLVPAVEGLTKQIHLHLKATRSWDRSAKDVSKSTLTLDESVKDLTKTMKKTIKPKVVYKKPQGIWKWIVK